MDRMPTLFVGHGSPMNAIDDNSYTRALTALAAKLPRPEAVLCVSAHYLTRGVGVTSSEHPHTIHDFYGFPGELYEVEYPAPGAPGLAEKASELAGGVPDPRWGLDHASWAVLRHMWPEADVPVVELSLDLSESPEAHYRRGTGLAELRDEGVLVLGSGNLVHNLGAIDWRRPHGGYDWAEQFDAAASELIEQRHDAALVDYASLPGGTLSVPSLDHYLPLLYALAAAPGEQPTTIYEGLEYGSVSMRCVLLG